MYQTYYNYLLIIKQNVTSILIMYEYLKSYRPKNTI